MLNRADVTNLLARVVLLGILPCVVAGHTQTKPGGCACVRQGLPGALKPTEGAGSVEAYRLARGGAVRRRGSHRVVFKLDAVNPKALLLGISPADRLSTRQIITGWEEIPDAANRAQSVYHLQVFSAGPGTSARLLGEFTVDDPRVWLRFFTPPDARDEPLTLIDVAGGAGWTTTYLLRSDRLEELFDSSDYDVIDLDRDGVYEIVSWQRRPNDIRCQFGFFGLRVYPEIYARSGTGYNNIWPGPEWAPSGGTVESAVNAVRRGEPPDKSLPWGSPLQIMGTFADVDTDGALELVTLTDSLTAEASPQYLALYKLEHGAMRLVTRSLLPHPWTAMLLKAETVPGGSRFVVMMADPQACGGGHRPDDPGIIHALYEFRAGQFERTGTRVNHSLVLKVSSMHRREALVEVTAPNGVVRNLSISQSKPEGRCGLGENTEASKVKIKWDDGKTQEFSRVPADQVLEIHEPSPDFPFISTVAGSGAVGFAGDGGPATAAALKIDVHGSAVAHIAVDAAGGVFITDILNQRIRKVDAVTGIITTVAGDGFEYPTTLPGDPRQYAPGVGRFGGDGGPATLASFRSPSGIAFDASGDLYVADSGNHRVRKIDRSGLVETIAGRGQAMLARDGSPATSAWMTPVDVAVDPAGNVFVLDSAFNTVRRIDRRTGIITTVAGNSQRSPAQDRGPAVDSALDLANGGGIAVDSQGNIFIAESSANRVRRVDAATGMITTVAGDWFTPERFAGDGGPAIEASLHGPKGLAVDAAGNLYIADEGNHRIRKVDAGTRIITTVAGSGAGRDLGDEGNAADAGLCWPVSVALDRAGNLFIADTCNNRIRRVSFVEPKGKE